MRRGREGQAAPRHVVAHVRRIKQLTLRETAHFLFGGEKEKHPHQQEPEVLEEAVKPHQDGNALPQTNRHPCRPFVGKPHGQRGAQHAPPIHGEDGQQVEAREQGVRQKQVERQTLPAGRGQSVDQPELGQ